MLDEPESPETLRETSSEMTPKRFRGLTGHLYKAAAYLAGMGIQVVTWRSVRLGWVEQGPLPPLHR